MTTQINNWEAFEKDFVGKNACSVYTNCRSCNTWGICFPLDNVCGNCGKDTDTYKYYQAKDVTKIITLAKQQGYDEGYRQANIDKDEKN